MKKLFSILALLLALSTVSRADSCGKIVDQANVLGDTSSLSPSIDRLTNAGVRVHFVTVDMSKTPVLKNYVYSMCPEWKDPSSSQVLDSRTVIYALGILNGRAKTIGMYYGAYWSSKLGANSEEIKSQAKPLFISKNFVGGFQDEADFTTSMIAAKKVVGNAPVTIKQATDYSGFYSFLKWALVVLFFGVVGSFIYYDFYQKKKEKNARKDAQTIARSQKTFAVQKIAIFEQSAETEKDKAKLRNLQAELDSLTSSIKYDVDSDLTESEYKFIGNSYFRLGQKASVPEPLVSNCTPAPSKVVAESHKTNGYNLHHTKTTYTTVVPEVNVIESAPEPIYYDPIIVPVIEEPLYVPESTYTRVQVPYETPVSEDEPSADYDAQDDGADSDMSADNSSVDSGSDTDL
jgi:hypothetical protein